MIEITNAAKLIFPDAGLTKADLVGHYARVADRMLPHVVDRPLTLERYPNGIGEKGFMQKNAADYFPASIGRVELPKKGGTVVHPVLHDAEGILYLANLGTITFHVPATTISDPGHPERLIFDLDPPDGGVADAQAAATEVRSLLEALGLPSFPMATGAKGYHTVTPLEPGVAGADVAELAQSVAVLLAAKEPDLATIEFQKKNRRGRVFVDWLRNFGQATSVVPWSLRPRPGAPVAVPITWAELANVAPDNWTLPDVAARLAEPDAWSGFEAARVDLGAALLQMRQLLDSAGLELKPFDRFRS